MRGSSRLHISDWIYLEASTVPVAAPFPELAPRSRVRCDHRVISDFPHCPHSIANPFDSTALIRFRHRPTLQPFRVSEAELNQAARASRASQQSLVRPQLLQTPSCWKELPAIVLPDTAPRVRSRSCVLHSILGQSYPALLDDSHVR